MIAADLAKNELLCPFVVDFVLCFYSVGKPANNVPLPPSSRGDSISEEDINEKNIENTNEDNEEHTNDADEVVVEAKRRRKSPPVQIRQASQQAKLEDEPSFNESLESEKPVAGRLSLKSPLDLEARNETESPKPDMAGSIQAALAALQAGQISLHQLSMQLMALGANSPGLWQSQLAAVAARQLSTSDRSLPAPANEIQAIQAALQQQQQNIQQHLQNLLLLQQSANSLGNNNVPISAAAPPTAAPPQPPPPPPPAFMGNQV